MIEIPSHQASLRRSLERLQSRVETTSPVASTSVWNRWASIATVSLLLSVAVIFASWWAGDMSNKVVRSNLIIPEKSLQRESRTSSDTAGPAAMFSTVQATGPDFPELYFSHPERQGFEQFSSVVQVMELEHFKPEFPSYTLGGRIDRVYVFGSPQSPAMDVTYTNGIAFRASVDGSRPHFAQSIRNARKEGFLASDEMPYLVGLFDTVGLVWPASHDSQVGVNTSAVVTWWEKGISYDVTTGKYNLKGRESSALKEVERIAESFSGDTRVPAPGEKINIPPRYVDIETAQRATGFKFRVPEYTAGGTVTDVYKRIEDNFADFSYSNGLRIAVDAGGKQPRDMVSEYESYKEAMAAYRKGSPEIDQSGVEAVPVEIAGNKGLLMVRKDRHILTPPDFTGYPTQILPSLLWWEGKTAYSLLIDDEKAFTPNIETGIRKMLRIARSMYD